MVGTAYGEPLGGSPHHGQCPLAPPTTSTLPSLSALIKYIQPVFVSRTDQDSRRKTVEEIKRRAQSGGKWPQVGGLVCVLLGFISKGMNVGVKGEIET